MIGYDQTVASQYKNSPIIMGMIDSFNAAVDPSINIDSFYNLIWNVETAQGYGLDVWGRIVGVSRVLQVAAGQWLGFNEANNYSVETPFGQAPFYDGTTAATQNYALADSSFRTLIYAKAYLNITNASIPAINNILMELFGTQGQCWCADGEDMTMGYVFNFQLDAVSYAIIEQSGAIPKPVGVGSSIIQLTQALTNDSGVLIVSGISNYPTSPSRLSAGALWSNGTVVSVAGTTTPSSTAPAVYYGSITALNLLTLGGSNLPLTNPGSGTGQLWNNGGVVSVA